MVQVSYLFLMMMNFNTAQSRGLFWQESGDTECVTIQQRRCDIFEYISIRFQTKDLQFTTEEIKMLVLYLQDE